MRELRHSRYALASLALCALGSLACGDNSSADSDGYVCTEIHKEFPVALVRSIDILLVVDDSVSMDDEAMVLRANLQRFANVLENIEGGLPNIHMAVVASTGTASTLGQFETAAQGNGCQVPSDAFLIDNVFANGERERNYADGLGDTMECMAALPNTGQRIEQPLEAVRAALDGTHPGNAGFLRESAFLFVLFLGDEDDCSGGNGLGSGTDETNSAWQCFADSVQCDQSVSTTGTKSGCTAASAPTSLTPIADYVAYLRGLKADPALVIVSAARASGDPVVIDATPGPALSPTCVSPRSATPSPRLEAFLAQFPNRNISVDVCLENWSDALTPIADTLTFAMASPCIEGNIDLDADTPGVQHECVVSQIQYLGSEQQSEQLLLECSSAEPDDSEKPCWRIPESSRYCSPDNSYELEVIRGREIVPTQLTISAHCHAGCVAL